MSTTTATGILPFVLAAARRGWHVFPLAYGTKRPDRRFRDWERHATTDLDRIRAFWGRGRFNYGIATGPSRLVVVDLDTPKPDEQPPAQWRRPGIADGADVFADLAETAGVLAEDGFTATYDTFTVRTRRGGRHLYYTRPEHAAYRNTTGKLGWLIDTRAAGGYVVGPGSYVADDDGTGTYTVENPAPAAPLPPWLAQRLGTRETEPVTSGQVHALLASHRNLAGYAVSALRGEVERVLAARPGNRNHTLNCAAFALGQLVGAAVLPKHLVTDALTEAGTRTGLSQGECEATVRSGLQAGLREPRKGAA